MDPAQLRPRFEAEFLAEQGARPVVVVERLALSALQVERAHQEGAGTLPQGEGGDVGL